MKFMKRLKRVVSSYMVPGQTKFQSEIFSHISKIHSIRRCILQNQIIACPSSVYVTQMLFIPDNYEDGTSHWVVSIETSLRLQKEKYYIYRGAHALKVGVIHKHHSYCPQGETKCHKLYIWKVSSRQSEYFRSSKVVYDLSADASTSDTLPAAVDKIMNKAISGEKLQSLEIYQVVHSKRLLGDATNKHSLPVEYQSYVFTRYESR